MPDVVATTEVKRDEQNTFEVFLGLFSPDLAEANTKFEGFYRRMVFYFENRGLSPPQDFVDRVIDRIISLIGRGTEIRDINRYAYRVARYIRLEAQGLPIETYLDDEFRLDAAVDDTTAKRILPESLILDPHRIEKDRNDEESQRVRSVCRKTCFANLSTGEQSILIRFCRPGENDTKIKDSRKQLASELNKTLGALYKYICKMRKRLNECTDKCARNAKEKDLGVRNSSFHSHNFKGNA